jgi:pyruvate,water dikinase
MEQPTPLAVPTSPCDRLGCVSNEHWLQPDVTITEGTQGEGGRMGSYVLGFQEIDRSQVAVVGGKGAHLGELSRIEGIHVPAGFCVTANAFRRIMADVGSMDDRLDRLSRLNPDDREEIRTLSAEIRRTLEGIAIPDDLAGAITGALARLGEQAGYAVRSSATAEDLPAASFAGQHDTYLNVVGSVAILEHISRSWASLSLSGP